MAMYGDCPHRIELVTSGTRASLILDLHNAGAWPNKTLFCPGSEGNMPIANTGSEHALDAAARSFIATALKLEAC